MDGARTLILLAIVAASSAASGNKLISPRTKIAVARSPLMVNPSIEWNKLDARPGRNAETWTLDGDALNDVTFYGGIPAGKTLFAEVDKRNRPLPRVSATMLLTDIPPLFENSYRIALDTPLMNIDSVEPMAFAGSKGVRFTYSFTRQNEEVHRRGEGRAAMIGGKLYMITYEAPILHYFDKSLAAFRQLADSASF
ncbi:hypothetical protein O4H52_16375 [Sphingomonadaceae bacterium G21617-S1]|jgi:hypothetical protein|uniref:hypothetical protein n=1 Tax=Rhizorhabdus sp. TaxID=1968843 RepID=UPI0011FB7146|nr:hypothetical protein [Rhizorhabdus sp.]MBD3760019.1 hypothetical protein [Rhizorhabdus sp.]MCZ4343194.1 hypothetical protein [Sphingomonadaceae bacterium G21617-S1]TAK08664.1 MAG: hypothetical protein EPO38_10790 [Rhizorhabdus sp.]